ncbi:DUF4407 domain-containing protein [Mycobacterium sp. Y57]|uniref:DUF4407 domain-containing protein n=1 Tax=Mycolicibacterium xanthum TaxID=2796469 RepID=UPI001C85A7C2|nr:DUF4407 domain-containing protein [Mycolicibacterium xanthum]MBX7432638.1 DUF4407 domain-containing protein [Mycolicibacterium xanthum]
MPANNSDDSRAGGSRWGSVLTWIGGGERRELDEPRQRSVHAIGGAVVLVGALLAASVVTLAAADATQWPVAAALPVGLGAGVLVGAVSRAIAAGPVTGWAGVAARTTVAVAVAAVVGELAAMVLLAGSIDRQLDEQAARSARTAPAVVVAADDLDRTRRARGELDADVEQALRDRDDAMVVARCEFNPSPACPQTHITGVPGAGPETRTADEFLADAQGRLDAAVARRDQRAPVLDGQIDAGETALAQARDRAVAAADRGPGARWTALNELTRHDTASMLVRAGSIGFFVLLLMLPLILKQWRGETAHDRRAAGRAARERAEVAADTAIAVKRAEVRAATEMLWAEQQLVSARLAVEAQTEIDREQHRRRVEQALEAPIPARSQRPHGPVDDAGLPPAAEATPPVAELTAGTDATADDRLPAPVEPGRQEPPSSGASTLVPSIPDITRTAARWIRPFVPPIVASAIDTTTRPLRATRQVVSGIVEEVEEMHLTLTRTRRVTVHSESEEMSVAGDPATADVGVVRPGTGHEGGAGDQHTPIGPGGRGRLDRLDAPDASPELTHGDHPRGLDGRRDPRQLPPGE